jgi:cytochrome c-type biogenesis protein CcmE
VTEQTRVDRKRRFRWWKVIGAAAFVGVAATGVVIARAERRRRAYTPEEIRTRLRDRLEEVASPTR